MSFCSPSRAFPPQQSDIEESLRPKLLPLGIGDVSVPLGAHVANWYRERDEKFSTLAAYFAAGVDAGQFCVGALPEEDIDDFRAHAAGLKEGLANGQVQILPAETFYFKNKRFRPVQLVKSFPRIIESAAENGFKSVRAAGEIPWRLMVHLSIPGFFEYEERVNADFFDCYPVIGMCLFDMERYGTEWTLGILRTHPMMLAKGVAFENPSYYQG